MKFGERVFYTNYSMKKLIFRVLLLVKLKTLKLICAPPKRDMTGGQFFLLVFQVFSPPKTPITVNTLAVPYIISVRNKDIYIYIFKNVRKSERLKIKWKKLNGPSSANIKLNLGFYFSCPILGS